MSEDGTDKSETDADAPDRDRREALVSIARFGAYVTPAMTVLVSPAGAFHATPGHCNANPNIKGCSTL
ncbi:MAG TPA: hypothetical protein VHG92_12200 [Afifellaceae bacterium]|nr:hypothetical protein [Afifellaceae bacterium]